MNFPRVLAIVASFLSALPAATLAQPATPAADTIFIGGTVLTMAASPVQAEALAVRDGRIVAVGSRAQVEALKGAATAVVDLKGGTLMPGFIEAHGHPFDAAFAQFLAVDIRPFTVKDAAGVDAAIRAAVRRAKPGEWVFLNGLDTLLQKNVRTPTLRQLNDWAPNNPLLIVNNSGHAAYGNAQAFKLAGITAATVAPAGSRIGKGPDGQLTGTVEELPAMNILMQPVMGIVTPAQTIDLLRRYYRYLASRGITAVSDMSFNAQTLPVYQTMEKEPSPPPRVFLYEIARADGKGTLPPGGGSEFVRQNGIKWWSDGSPWLGTIAVSKPYLNNDLTLKVMGLPANDKGMLNYVDVEALQQQVDGYHAQGYQIAFHAEGDVAIDQALTVLEAAAAKTPRPDARPKLQHVPMMNASHLQRARQLGAHLSFLMTHIYYWGDFLPQMLGDERADNWNPVGAALKAGLPISFHNDGPVTPADPLLDFQVAVLRQAQGSGRVLGPGQRITVEQALRGRTIDSAQELFAEKEIGSLEPGKRADLVVLAQDPRKVRSAEISKIRVNATYIGGKQVYKVAVP